MSQFLVRTAFVVLVAAALALGTGALFEPAWGWSLFSAALLGLLLHHVRHVDLLRRWAARPPAESVPEGTGVWQEVLHSFTAGSVRRSSNAASSRTRSPAP